MFHRDEVDLLEEDIDDLYDLHESRDGRIQTMEQAIISEQLDTEEFAEADFAMHIDMRWLTDPKKEVPPWDARNERVCNEESLKCDVERPPFYEHVFRFADHAYAYAMGVYDRKQASAEHAFRVCINVKMVPIKCANGIFEETYDDPMSRAVAKKEFRLAIVYLERVLISFAFLASEGDEHAHAFLAPGSHLKHILEQHLARLSNRRGVS